MMKTIDHNDDDDDDSVGLWNHGEKISFFD